MSGLVEMWKELWDVGKDSVGWLALGDGGMILHSSWGR
jgi:hypothetical protein